MKFKLLDIDYQRNGVSGTGFYAAKIQVESGEILIATFESNEYDKVIDTAQFNQ